MAAPTVGAGMSKGTSWLAAYLRIDGYLRLPTLRLNVGSPYIDPSADDWPRARRHIFQSGSETPRASGAMLFGRVAEKREAVEQADR
jgi:hypothetical protein